MLIGLDVGGTFTDAVLIDQGEIVRKIKFPTNSDDLLDSLMNALDPLLETAKSHTIQRIVTSTTLITNLIATNNIEPVALVLIPGPGRNPRNYQFEVPDTYVLSGAIDYRGREIAPLKESEISSCIEHVKQKGLRRVAIVGKFSQRNKAQEQAVADRFASHAPEVQLVLGHQVSSQLNYPRRIVTALLTLATQDQFRHFFAQVSAALSQRGVTAPLYILKADGGTLPFEQALGKPVETIFSGPAASTLGVLALTPAGQTSVVLDVGGTTTDLALILSGRPLLASRGASIARRLTHVRAFATKSVALGGDSILSVANGHLEILPRRAGPAYCLGGPGPTPTDAMRHAGLTDIGDAGRAAEAMRLLGGKLHLQPGKSADLVLAQMVKQIDQEIQAMFLAWEQEPAYRIWELLQKQKVRPQSIIGIGGSAPALLPLLAQATGCQALAPPHHEVANAIGAALARVTLRLTFHFDTERNFYFIEETGWQDKLTKPLSSLSDAEQFCFAALKQAGGQLGIASSEEPELVYSEMFNMVRGWRTTGRLYDVCVQFPPGIQENWQEGGRQHA
ncbi:MAG: hydantoinase/oxoprolinase family protein [Thermacetogeniaceae bacterium]